MKAPTKHSSKLNKIHTYYSNNPTSCFYDRDLGCGNAYIGYCYNNRDHLSRYAWQKSRTVLNNRSKDTIRRQRQLAFDTGDSYHIVGTTIYGNHKRIRHHLRAYVKQKSSHRM